jgi:aminopeptidase C
MGYNKNNTKVKVESSLFSGLCFMFVVFNARFSKLIKEKKVAANELSIDDIPLE